MVVAVGEKQGGVSVEEFALSRAHAKRIIYAIVNNLDAPVRVRDESEGAEDEDDEPEAEARIDVLALLFSKSDASDSNYMRWRTVMTSWTDAVNVMRKTVPEDVVPHSPEYWALVRTDADAMQRKLDVLVRTLLVMFGDAIITNYLHKAHAGASARSARVSRLPLTSSVFRSFQDRHAEMGLPRVSLGGRG